MKSPCARFFTLVEVLVVIAIVGIAASTLGIAGKRAVDHWRFKSSRAGLVARLNLAQQIAITCETPVTLTFDQGALYLTADSLPAGYEKLLDKPLPLKGIQRLEPTTLTFSPRRRDLYPKGDLLLNDQTIPLPGFPTEIK